LTTEFQAFSIVECSTCDADIWDALATTVSGTYCHLFGWKQVFERAYGLQTHYLSFRSADAWLGVLPVAVMPRLPGGVVKAVSLPYCNYGGLLTAPGVDAEALKAAAIKYLGDIGVDKIEFRDLAPGMADAGEVTMVLTFPATSELLWKQLNDNVRRNIRKAEKAGLTLRWGRDQVDELYSIFADNMGRLGTPVHSPKFIQEIVANLSDWCNVLTVRYEDRAIGAMLIFYFGDTWSDPLVSCLDEYNKFSPNMLIHWEAVKSAFDAKAKLFDFGRSHKESGTYRFKKQWGANEVALNYHSYKNGALLPSASTDFYRSKSASRLADIWRRLPAAVQGRLGPVVRRWLP
jgi:FemAB-related protein (PEP-CTERM system-associated)